MPLFGKEGLEGGVLPGRLKKAGLKFGPAFLYVHIKMNL
jgi:hypothetical protein